MRAWHLPVRALTWDIFGYYLYLPAQFVHDDLLLQDKVWIDQLMADYRPSTTLYQVVRLDNGNGVMKYSMGSALALSPFYFLSDIVAGISGYPRDGFSMPYQLIMSLGGLFYAFIGLFLLSQLLRRYFDERTVILTIAVIFFGTNYLHLTAWDGTLLTHNILFAFYAALLLATDSWHKNPKGLSAILVGICLGMITIIRPSEAVAALIPLLWGLGNNEDFSRKWKAVIAHPGHVLLLIFMGIIAVAPQLLYWKAATGQWLFFSYTNAGEGLDFSDPHTMDFLFSFRKGWFLYTPIMLLAFVGFWRIWKEQRGLFWAFIIFILVDIYVASSWTTWWYAGGSFSSRSMVPAYTVMAFPIAYLIRYLFRTDRRFLAAATSVASFFVLLNLFQTWQFQHDIISRERMTKDYYWAVFGKTEIPEGAEELLMVERSLRPDFEGDFDRSKYSSRELFDSSTELPNGFSLRQDQPYGKGVKTEFNKLTSSDHAWIEIESLVHLPEGHNDSDLLIVATFEFEGEYYNYRAYEGSENIVPGEWNSISLTYLTPETRTEKDKFSTYLWYRGTDTIQVESFRVKIFEPI